MYLPLISITKLLKSFYFSSEVNNDCSSLESTISTLQESVDTLTGEGDGDMSISEYLEAIYQNTGGESAITGIATIASAIKVGTIAGVTSGTIDISSYVGNYTELTEDNFLVQVVSYTGTGLVVYFGNQTYTSQNISASATAPTKSYDPDTGVVTVSNLYVTVSALNGDRTSILASGKFYINVDVYLFGVNVDLTTSS